MIFLAVFAGITVLVVIWAAGFTWAERLLEKPQKHKCRNCKSTNLYFYQDGGHDYVEGCRDCGARYGVQDAPFNLVERISDGPVGEDAP